MALGAQAIFDAIESHALASGLFDSVNTHEPKSAPGGDVHCAIYVARIRPAPAHSGLASSSAVVDVMARIYVPFIQEPQDKIDPNIVVAADTLIEDFSADFTLGGNAFAIDLLGQAGQGIDARAGYIEIDQTVYRSMDIQIPVIVADAFTQAP